MDFCRSLSHVGLLETLNDMPSFLIGPQLSDGLDLLLRWGSKNPDV